MKKRAHDRLAAIRTLAVALAVFLGACSDDPALSDFEDDDRGALLGIQQVEVVSRARIESFDLPIRIGSDVRLTRLVYRTVDARGALTEASALVAIPSERSGALPLVSYQHGTVAKKDAVASLQGTEDAEALVAVAFATDGYAAVMPDYLGLGLSPGLHPFVHAASLATSVVDALRAVRHYAKREDVALDGRVFLMGYSEGGYATAAAQRHIEARHADEFNLAASAPMAAPWDLSGVMVDVFRSEQAYRAPFFLPYVLLAYNDAYGIEEDLSKVFVAPYDRTLPGLFDGSRSGGDIDRELPEVPREMLTQPFIAAFDAPDPFPWRDRLRENDLLAWAPTTRTRVFHCVNDDLIPFASAEIAIESFRQLGVPDSRVDFATGDYGTHGQCAPVFLLLGKFWMDEIRSGTASKTQAPVEQLRRLAWRPIG